MVDPTRRKNLASHAPPQLAIVESEEADNLVVRSFHSTSPGSADLLEFAEGRSDDMKGRGSGRWSGGYRGRPELIGDLLPMLRQRNRLARNSVITGFLPTALRSLWRFLDTLDGIDGLRVDSLADINDLHGTQYLRSKPQYATYVAVKGYIEHGRKAMGLPPVFWPPAPAPELKPNDVPEAAVVRAMYSELKRNVFEAKRRWEAAPGLADGGIDWAGLPRSKTLRWTTADIHATLRGIIRKSGDALPNGVVVSQYLRKKAESNLVFPLAWGPVKKILPQLYPTKFDTLNFFYLFLLRTGWNAQVALDIDISTPDWAQPHPTSSDHVMVYSLKSRGDTQQSSPSRIKGSTEPYTLITSLMEVVAPLREKLRSELEAAEGRLKVVPDDLELFEAVAELRAAIRSPWLFFDSATIGQAMALNLRNYSHLNGTKSGWNRIIEQYNARTRSIHARMTQEGVELKPPVFIPRKFLLSDLRDAFVSHAYAVSGYSWMVAKLAAGHKSLSSLRRYLRQRQWRAHGEKKVLQLTSALWSEIQVHRKVEPAFLRALVERGEVTDEQRKRWLAHKDRTRLGMGCKDFRNPPRTLVPDHVEGEGCRVQRCILCDLGIVFDDSLSGLTCRLAELETLRTQIPVPTWNESTFPDEMDSLNATLDDFAADAVAELLQYWRREIAEGRHRVLDFEGSYD